MNTPTLTRRQWLKAGGLLASNLIVGWGAAPRSVAGALPAGIAPLSGEQHPWGPSLAAREAQYQALEDGAATQELAERLRKAIARAEQVKPEQVVLGHGSTELFSLAAHFAAVGTGSVLTSTPAYSPWLDYAVRLGAGVHALPVDPSTRPDFAAMLAALSPETRLVYLSNPNYPFGGLLQPYELAPFCRQAAQQALVLVDEASLNYVAKSARCSMVELVREGVENVLVTRTFSKLYALPGLRVGYAIAGPKTAAALRQRQAAPNESVATPALAAALAAYQDVGHEERIRTAARRVREYYHRLFDKLAIHYEPSFAGYASFSLASFPAIARQYLELEGLQLHYFSVAGATWARTALGTPEQIKLLSAKLTELRRVFPLGSQPRELLVSPGSSGS